MAPAPPLPLTLNKDSAAPTGGMAGSGRRSRRCSYFLQQPPGQSRITPNFTDKKPHVRAGAGLMAGVDWAAMGDSYRPLLDRIACSDDLLDVLWELQGEI